MGSPRRSWSDTPTLAYPFGMADHTGADLGKNIKYWRKRRGKTQQWLADRVGVTQELVSRWETGTRVPDGKAMLAVLADALQITVAELLSLPGHPVNPMRERALVWVGSLRSALVELSVGERRQPQMTLDVARARLRELTELRNAADHAAMAPRLPDLLLELGAHGNDAGPELVEATFAARFALKTWGLPDLATIAAQVGVQAARDHGDPAWGGQAEYSLVQAMPAESAQVGYRQLVRALAALEHEPGSNTRQVFGCLHLLAAGQAAASRRGGDALTHLQEAEQVAAVLGEPRRYGTLSAGINGNWFGPAQVLFWRIAVAAELGDTSAAAAAIAAIDREKMPVPNRWVYGHTDYARTLIAAGDDVAALVQLDLAEQAAPQHFGFNMVAYSMVKTIVERARQKAITPRMQQMAQRLGLRYV